MSPASRERDKENPRRGKGKEGRGAPPGRKRDRQILGEGHNARLGRKREKERRERQRKKKRQRETERERQKTRIKGKRSKGYLHRVVFFQYFLFEQFVERLSRLIFGMMSMNYILYKIRQRFSRAPKHECAFARIDRLTRVILKRLCKKRFRERLWRPQKRDDLPNIRGWSPSSRSLEDRASAPKL